MSGGVARSRTIARAGAARRELDWVSTAQIYQAHLTSHPKDFGLWVQLGHALKEAGDLNAALIAYQTARSLRHLDPDLLLSLGHLFKLKDEPAHAYSYYKLSYEMDGNANALLELVRFPANGFAPGAPARSTVSGPPMSNAEINGQTIPLIRKAIEQSGLFDAKWYENIYLRDTDHHDDGDDLNGEAKSETDPLEHFLFHGIAAGHDPSERFSSQGYVIANPDIGQSGVNPFLHFLWVGIGEGRPVVLVAPDAYEQVRKTLPDMFTLRQRVRRARIAVVAHVYYPEIWQEIRDLLPNIRDGFDLYVSVIKDISDDFREEILGDYPDAHVLVFPNHGRDCFPFTEFLNAGVLEGYDMVCKLHTKRSLHRDDGDEWRSDLYNGLVGSPETVDSIITEMRTNPDAGIFVPDGYIFTTEFLGSNVGKLQILLDRVNLSFDLSEMRFPSGNMFWISAASLQYLKALKLQYLDYDVEAKQLDGTIAHALERFAGIACIASAQRILTMADIQTRVDRPYSGDRHRLIAFYLPQFHPIPENDRWWGKGFTEWHNLQKGVPRYHGHNQPRFPSELGYYDLRLDQVREQQAALARDHGVNGFCYYHYWFDGRTLLDMPLKRLISSKLDFPFCICWANENWTRSWDGLNRDILLHQTYDPAILRRYASDVATYLRDPRYIRHEDKPLFLIYKIMDIPDVAACLHNWRETWRREGVGEVHVAAVRTFIKDPARRPEDLGLDAYVDFPPQSLARYAQGASVSFTREFNGLIYDYQKAVAGDLARYETEESAHVHRGVMGCWDNSARRGPDAHIAHGASPITYRAWLRRMMIQDDAANPQGDRLIFINAWNEWAEGTYLEPDQRYGRAFLEATKSVRSLES